MGGNNSSQLFIDDNGNLAPVTFGLYKVLDNPNPYSTSANDNFAFSVAISDNYAIVGAYTEDDAGATNSSGKAYIYSTATGSLLYTLNNANPYGSSEGDQFGQSVDISNSYAIVGASLEDEAAGTSSGKAYIYSTSTGSLLYTLNNPNPYSTVVSDQFGVWVGISESYAIVGANFEDDASGVSSGKAYIYSTTTGSLLYTLNNPNPFGTSQDDRFGNLVAISNNYAIVGAYLEDEAAGNSSGKAYVYDLSDGSLLYTLNNPNAYSTVASDQFGFSVAITDTHAIVGAQGEDDAGGASSGKAYIYDLSDGSLLYTLDNPTAFGTSASDQFGYSVDISDSYAIVGAPFEDSAGLTDLSSGKAYIYDLSDGSLVDTLDNPNPFGYANNDQFGYSVSITDTHAVVGSLGSADAGGTTSGTAYLYNRNESEHITVDPELAVLYTFGAQSTASTITIPAGVVAGDLLVLFDTSTTTTLTVPSGWTQISTITTTGIRTTVSYRIATTGALGGNTVTGMAGTTRKVMLSFRNTQTGSVTVGTISSPQAQATTAAPGNQIISGGTRPCIYFACHAFTASTPTRTWTGTPTGVTFAQLSSISTSGIEARHLVYNAGVNENALVNATISQTDGGTNAMISFRMNVS
jgi:hypothetical protein